MTPGHQITIEPTDQQVDVRIEGETVATSTRTLRLDETGMPPRFYFPRDDVRTDILRRTAFETTCPFKGQASYWRLGSGEGPEKLAWSYEAPYPEVARIAGFVAFYQDQVRLQVGTAPYNRPT